MFAFFLKILHMAQFFPTGTACGTCDKYDVCACVKEMINIKYDMTSNPNVVSKQASSPVWRLFAVGRVTAETTCPPMSTGHVQPGPSKHAVPSQIRDNGWDFIKFYREAILVNLLLSHDRKIELHQSVCGSKAGQGMWSDSNPVKLVPPRCRSCFELPHWEMSIAARYLHPEMWWNTQYINGKAISYQFMRVENPPFLQFQLFPPKMIYFPLKKRHQRCR